jgi:hypothetical protein
MSAPKKSKALLKLEKTIGVMEDEHLNEESRAFRDRLRAALAPHAPLPPPGPSRSGRVHNYGTSKYRTTHKGGKKSRKSRKSSKSAKKAHKKAHKKTHKK